MNRVHLEALALTFGIQGMLALAYWGWGRVFLYGVGLKGRDREGCPVTLCIWAGWAWTLLLLQGINLVLPLDFYPVAIILGLGLLVGMPKLLRGGLANLWRQGKQKPLRVMGLMGMAGMVFVWVASRGMVAPINYDSGLYHFTAMRWINSYPVVPGLGNLHGRLAFNQAYFTYAAALNFHPLFDQGRSLANSFLFFLTTASCLETLWPMWKRPARLMLRSPLQWGVALFSLPILAYLTFYGDGLAAPAPDLACNLLQMVMLMLLAGIWGGWRQEHAAMPGAGVVLGLLAVTAITIKLSNVMFAGVILALLVGRLWLMGGQRMRAIARIVIPGVVILAVWGVRGYLLSGAPLFPSSVGYVATEWAMPVEKVQEEANWVYSWARQPEVHWSKVLGNWKWLESWLGMIRRETTGVIIPLGITVAAVGVSMAGMIGRKGRKGGRGWGHGILMLPLVAGLVFWFLTAPELRFASAMFLLLPVTALLLLLAVAQNRMKPKLFAGLVGLVLVAGNLHLFHFIYQNSWVLRWVAKSGWENITQVAIEEKVTKSGLHVFTPREGDQCWDTKLICTPNFNRNLRQRDPEHLEAGFTVRPGAR